MRTRAEIEQEDLAFNPSGPDRNDLVLEILLDIREELQRLNDRFKRYSHWRGYGGGEEANGQRNGKVS